jgi:glucose 1-dehydrogenase
VQLKEMTAIVTGGATGIGRAIALAFGAQGACVVVDYRDESEHVGEVVSRVQSLGGKALAVCADVTDPAGMQQLVSRAQEAFGPLRVMVNNAGIEEKHPFLETPLDVYRRIIDVNLTGVWIGAQTAARAMAAHRKGGRIINISSIHEDVAMPTNAAYCASKGGVRMLARTIAVELAQYDITVNDVCPGAVETPMDVEIEKHPAEERKLMAEIPLRRMGKPEEIAALCVYLASPAAAYVTGASFVIDGGMMRQSGSL